MKEHGFDERHGALKMEHYCDRQEFNVAGIENGYRDEVTDLIQRTSKEEKKFCKAVYQDCDYKNEGDSGGD